MNKVLVFGDIHGRTLWKDIYEYHKKYVDTVIFLGDYFDNKDFSFTNEQIINNFIDINKVKSEFENLKENNKVYYLLGNHDLPYLFFRDHFSCSGFDYSNHIKNNEVLAKYIAENDNYYLSVKIGNTYFSHAGINPMFIDTMKDKLTNINPYEKNLKITDLEESEIISLTPVDYYRGGDNKYGGLTWNDLNSFYKSIKEYEEKYPNENLNITNVIGHTPVNDYTVFEFNSQRIKCYDFLSTNYSKNPSLYNILILN